MTDEVIAVGEDGTEDPGLELTALTPRVFWGIFSMALLVYGGLFCSVSLSRGEGWAVALTGSLGTVVSPGLPSFMLAWHRRGFLRSRGSVRRFVVHKMLSGLGFAALAGVLAVSYFSVTAVPIESEWGNGPIPMTLAWAFNGLFIYTILLGFLMWADSMDRLQQSRAAAAQEAVLRAQAEAKALRAQFSPHFVFNTLHSLMLLVRADPATAERAIEDVAELIRYASTLQRRQVDRVPLSKELAFARRFISLEKLRLDERLQVDWAIERGLDDVFVPAFSLQTLLENSIKHGIAPKPAGGSIVIRARSEGPSLELVVEDDGLGAELDQVRANGGSGLQLLERRLQMVYDGAASLNWSTAVNGGFRVVVRVPIQRTNPAAEPAPQLS